MSKLLDEVVAILESSGIVDSAIEAERIIRAAQISTTIDHADTALAMAMRRASGVPIAYVTGREVFMGIELIVSEGVLFPRVETELLGKVALDTLSTCGAVEPRVIDMCCGSGNLACAIAHYLPNSRVWASDLTDNCIALTRCNVEHVGVSERVVVAQGDLFAGLAGMGLEGSIDSVVCGPPFISQNKLATERADLLKYEPREAFDGGPYGISVQQRVVKEVLPFLRPGGMLHFEIGVGQERQVKMLFERTKAYEEILSVVNAEGEVLVMSGRKRVG
jgi:release factor glutamine methyltransferase